MEEMVELFRTRLTYDRLGDHVEEVRFEKPVCVTSLSVGHAATVGGGNALLRGYARDLCTLTGGRYVPLCEATVACPENESTTVETEVIVTDSIVFRGRYQAIEILLKGYTVCGTVDEDLQMSESEQALQPLSFPQHRTQHSNPGPFLPTDLKLPYISGFPLSLKSALNGIMDLQDEELQGVNWWAWPSDTAVQEIFSAANQLCKAMGNGTCVEKSGGQVERTGSGVVVNSRPSTAGLEEGWVDVCLQWCRLLNQDSAKHSTVATNRGILGLAMSVLLCSSRSTAMHFLATGGLGVLSGVFNMRGLTALMVRYLVSACELISLTCGAVGCEALLGWWRPPDQKSTHDAKTAVDEGADVIHVPGILQVKVKVKKDEVDDGKGGADREGPATDGNLNQESVQKVQNLPPGMVTRGEAKSQGSRISPPLDHSPSKATSKKNTTEKDRNDRRRGKRKGAWDSENWTDDQDISEGFRNDSFEQGKKTHTERKEHLKSHRGGEQGRGRDDSAQKQLRNGKDSSRERSRKRDRKKHKGMGHDKEGGRRGHRDGRKRDDSVEGDGHKRKKSRHREKERDKEQDKERGGDCAKGKERKSDRHNDDERTRDRDRDRDRNRDKDRDRKHHKYKGREKERDRGRKRGHEKIREGDSGGEQLKACGKSGGGANTERRTKGGSDGKERGLDCGGGGGKGSGGKGGGGSGMDVDGVGERGRGKDNASGNVGPIVASGEGVSLYDMLVGVLMTPRPEAVVTSVSRLLSRLGAYEMVVAFKDSVKEAEKCVVDGGATSTVHELLVKASNSLQQVASEIQGLSKETGRRKVKGKSGSAGLSDLWSRNELDPCILQCLSSHNLLQGLSVLLHLPSSFSCDESTDTGRALQSVLLGVKAIIVQLVSTRSGIQFLRHHMKESLEFCGLIEKMGWTENGLEIVGEVVGLVGCVLRASEAVDVIVGSAVNASEAVNTLMEMLEDDYYQQAARFALLCNENSVPCLLEMLKARRKILSGVNDMDVNQQMTKHPPTQSNFDIPERRLDDLAVCEIQPHVVVGPKLLLEVSRDHSEWGVHCMCQFAKEIVDVVGEEVKQEGMDYGDSKGGLEEVLGRANACIVFKDSGHSGLMELLENLLPEMKSDVGKKATIKTVDKKSALELVRNRTAIGKATMTLNLIASQFNHNQLDDGTLVRMYGTKGIHTFKQALQSGITALLAVNCDVQWMVMAGDFRSDLQVENAYNLAILLIRAASEALWGLVRQLKAGMVEVNDEGCVKTLVEAHRVLTRTPESLGARINGGLRHSSVIKVQHTIACILSVWAEMEWSPDVIPVVFGCLNEHSLMEPPIIEPCEMYCNLYLLGDLFPTEWPPAKSPGQTGTTFPPPSNVKMRATLARWLRPCAKQLRHMIEFGLGSESQLVRCGVVRMCARAAGLGGGMGCFLAQPLLEELSRLCQSDVISMNHYRCLELFLALSMWPAMKAAFLDSEAVGCLSRLLLKLVTVPNDAGALDMCGILLDIFGILIDPDVCLNGLASLNERLTSDCPSPAQTEEMVSGLLPALSRLGDHAVSGQRLICTISERPGGHVAVAKGASKWHSTEMKSAESSVSHEDTLHSSVKWAVGQLQEVAENVQGDTKAVKLVSNACRGVAKVLQAIPEDLVEDDVREGGEPAPNRFKMAVQLSLQARASATGLDKTRSINASTELPDIHPLALVYDSCTQNYWRCSNGSDTSRIAKGWKKYPCETSGTEPASAFYSEGLAGRSRQRELPKGIYLSQIGSVSRTVVRDDGQDVKRSCEEPATVAVKVKQPSADLPPVLAPPRRGQDARRGRLGMGSSRAPSIHVDAFGKGGPEKEAGTAVQGVSGGGVSERNGLRDQVNMESNGPVLQSDFNNAEPRTQSGASSLSLPNPVISPNNAPDAKKTGTVEKPPDSQTGDVNKGKQRLTISFPVSLRKKQMATPANQPVQNSTGTSGTVSSELRLGQDAGPLHAPGVVPDRMNASKLANGVESEPHSRPAESQQVVPGLEGSTQQLPNETTQKQETTMDAGNAQNGPERVSENDDVTACGAVKPVVDNTPVPGGKGIDANACNVSGSDRESPSAPGVSSGVSGHDSQNGQGTGDGGVDGDKETCGVDEEGGGGPGDCKDDPGAVPPSKADVKSLLHNPSKLAQILKKSPQLMLALEGQLKKGPADEGEGSER